VIANGDCRRTQCQDFGVCCRIAVSDGPIVAACDFASLDNNHCADRYFTLCHRTARFVKRQCHPTSIVAAHFFAFG
jgi:hypothetical protein